MQVKDPLDLLIFDLDGTLAQTGEDLVCAVNDALRTLELPAQPHERIIGFVGDGISKLMERALGPEHRHRTGEALEAFNAYYGEHIMDHTVLYPGVAESLEFFRDKRKVLISNKGEKFVKVLVERLGIGHHFERVIGGDTYPFKKPDARLLTDLLADWGVEAGQTVVIGDGVNDVLLAKNAGAFSCAFLGGLTKREILLALEPDFVCEDMGALPKLFA